MTDSKRTHRLEGLEPDNLLAFLTLLGFLRALEVARPLWRPRAAWTLNDPPLRPALILAEPTASMSCPGIPAVEATMCYPIAAITEPRCPIA